MARDDGKERRFAHLDEDQVIMAVIDRESLSPEVKAHIEACAGCRARVEDLEVGLGRLGDMASELVPRTWRRPTLEKAGQEAARSKAPWGWKLALVAGLATLVLVFSITMFHHHPGVNQVVQVAVPSKLEQEMKRDAELESEVSVLLSDPLPRPFEDMTDVPGANAFEEFVDFVVPGAKG